MTPTHSDALVLFGATGDLAHKMTFPALYELARSGALNVPLVGVASSDWNLAQLRERVTDSVRQAGGAIDEGDGGPVGAALREAAEEVGLDPGGVDVVGTLPEVFIERTGFRVVPVLAWWRKPSAVAPVDAAEVAAVERVSVAELADPATRVMLRMPNGRSSPAFRVRGRLSLYCLVKVSWFIPRLGGFRLRSERPP